QPRIDFNYFWSTWRESKLEVSRPPRQTQRGRRARDLSSNDFLSCGRKGSRVIVAHFDEVRMLTGVFLCNTNDLCSKSFYGVLRTVCKLFDQDTARNCDTSFVALLLEKRPGLLSYLIAVRTELNARAACSADWFHHDRKAQTLCCFQ